MFKGALISTGSTKQKMLQGIISKAFLIQCSQINRCQALLLGQILISRMASFGEKYARALMARPTLTSYEIPSSVSCPSSTAWSSKQIGRAHV